MITGLLRGIVRSITDNAGAFPVPSMGPLFALCLLLLFVACLYFPQPQNKKTVGSAVCPPGHWCIDTQNPDAIAEIDPASVEFSQLISQDLTGTDLKWFFVKAPATADSYAGKCLLCALALIEYVGETDGEAVFRILSPHQDHTHVIGKKWDWYCPEGGLILADRDSVDAARKNAAKRIAHEFDREERVRKELEKWKEVLEKIERVISQKEL